MLVATSGNVLEWYDFTIYGFLAPTLAQVFFPGDTAATGVLSAFAVLAVGYAARPIGSVIFGHVGDRFGRRPALIVSVLLMGAGSILIGLLPSYAQAGLPAAVALVCIRIVQGISVAGEYTAAGVLVIEEARPGHRAFAGSWLAFAMLMGCAVGAAVPAAIASVSSEAEMQAWGWRIPFLLGGLVAILGGWLRRELPESSALESAARRPENPVWRVITCHWRTVLRMVLLLVPTAVIYFLLFVYAASYLVDEMEFSAGQALDITTVNLVVVALFALWVGRCADRWGVRTVWLAGAFGTLVFGGPLWWLMHQQNLALVFAGQFGLSLLNAIGWGLSITVLMDMAPRGLRCSAVALGYNACMALFGGTTPMVAAYLVTRSGSDFAPLYYVVLATALSLPVIWRLSGPTAAATREVA